MSQETEKFVGRLESKVGTEVQLDKEMAALTLRIVTRALFSADIEESEDELLEAFELYNQYVSDLSVNPARSFLFNINGRDRAFKKSLAKTDKLIYRLIKKRRKENTERYDLLAMLMGARDEETGEAMDDKMLRDEVMTFFFAGHETSANALNWTWYLLSQNEEIANKLREESFQLLGNALPSFTEVTQLQYTKQVVQESMRLYPPVWVLFRSNHQIDHLGDFEIPKDAFVALSVYNLHRNPAVWNDPYTFDPDRFTPENAKERDAFAYLPFGGGPRICIGNHFAMLEAQLIISVLSRHFKFEYTGKSKPEPRPLITLSPWEGMPMKVSLVE
jgi:cytochrome P450